MNRGWKATDLKVGTRVRVPETIFIALEKAQERLMYVEYIGQTHAGLLFRAHFMPGWTETETRSYRFFINWASIYCGRVKVYTPDGCSIRAKREEDEFDFSIGEVE